MQLTTVQLGRIKEFFINMPQIMHALADGPKAANMARIIHMDFHPFNIVLDFTQVQQPRTGIIDWGLLLRKPKKRLSLNFVFEADKHPEQVAEAQSKADREHLKRGWLAPKLYDPILADAYTEASDVYALGYLLQVLYDFWWRIAQQLWMGGTAYGGATIMDAILHKVNSWMMLRNREEQKSLVQIVDFLSTKPARAQRPLVELSVSFN